MRRAGISYRAASRLLPVDGAAGPHRPGRAWNGQSAVSRRNSSMPAGRWRSRSRRRPRSARSIALTKSTAISAIAKQHGLPLHMDGARFANALVSLDTTPAEMTWKRGVDIVSFGGTKNGCWCAEAVILFDLDQGRGDSPSSASAPRSSSRSRASSRPSSTPISRTICGSRPPPRQRHGRTAGRAHPRRSKDVRLAWEPQANEVFAIMDGRHGRRLQDKGAVFYDWHTPHGFAGNIGADEKLCRFVTSFATSSQEVDRLGDLIAYKRHALNRAHRAASLCFACFFQTGVHFFERSLSRKTAGSPAQVKRRRSKAPP